MSQLKMGGNKTGSSKTKTSKSPRSQSSRPKHDLFDVVPPKKKKRSGRKRKTETDEAAAVALPPQRRTRLQLEGVVQGVGFRPYVSRLAQSLKLCGWAANSVDGLTVEIEGGEEAIEDFLRLLREQLPPLARLDHIHTEELTPLGYDAFDIRDSLDDGAPTALVQPDVATCRDCFAEVFNQTDRRYRYPFTNCTNCGPRYSILEALPWDRANTTMRQFEMCPACRAEYENPADRRFHAQPNACPDCGPQLTLLDADGNTLAQRNDALIAAANALRDGRIVALKGLGGFQLLVDAHNAQAITRLRQRKQRPHKPFAVMAPSLAFAETACHVSTLERELLISPQAPIVLLRRRTQSILGKAPVKIHTAIDDAVAPGNPLLGVMLPYTPLHHLLLGEFGFPLVATSGNVSDEPMVIDNDEALQRLHDVADVFLVHDRPIACALDDSVVRVVAGRAMLLRRARGYAPLPIPMRESLPPLLALGGHLKAAVAMTIGTQVMVGPHIGDLDSAAARRAFSNSVERMRQIHAVKPVAIACDLHPGYYTTEYAQKLARETGADIIPVQHHVAHVAACMADNGIDGPVLGVAWDGTGYGEDGTIHGGEFIAIDSAGARRVAHLLPFALPGGDKAIIEPRRAAIGVLYEMFGSETFDEIFPAAHTLQCLNSFSAAERQVLARMLERGLNSPRTSSVGRLFDAVASLTGLVQESTFEGQAGMALEFALDDPATQARYRIDIKRTSIDQTGTDRNDTEADSPLILDWRPMLHELLDDIREGVPVAHMAASFHNTLADALVAVAEHYGETRVVLTGGCFQNRYLTECAVNRLRHAGFEPFWHQHVPPNDGGLALGQAVWASRQSGLMRQLEKGLT